MSVELIKDLLKIDQTIGKDQIQALVEGEITVPDSKPKINKVLNIDGSAEVLEKRIVKDKVVVSGIVNFKVLYSAKDDNQPIHSLDSKADFSEEIEIKGVTDQMMGDVKADIEHIDYSMTDEDKIGVKTVLSIEGKVQAEDNIDIVKEIQGTKGLQVKKEKIKYNNTVGFNNTTTIVNEAFELEEEMPDIIDILRVDSKAFERETKIVDDKAIVAGTVEVSIMYFGDDSENRINQFTREIPFTHFVEIPGALKDMDYITEIKATDPVYNTRDDINGNVRVMDFEAIVKINAKVFEQREKEVTVDTYSTNKKFDITKKEIDVTENIGTLTKKEDVKGVIDVSEANEIIQNIYNVNAKPILTDYRIIEGKVVIEGLVNTNMLYLEEESEEIKDISKEIPFKVYADIDNVKEGMESEVNVSLDNLKFNKKNSREVEVDISVKNNISVNRTKKINIITEALELEEDIDKRNRPSITIYIAQENDTLWDIAKRFNTTVEELISTNEIMTPNNIMPGEKIIIEKHLDMDF
ncbi:MAG: DUF3794 domain-containing protein [Firmicutes bacterium]|nr:DUF3794 domain-containing protein [Bacillota bacterium]MTI69380.1 DUF3794 domain-containing protein [Bacillota bacterium]